MSEKSKRIENDGDEATVLITAQDALQERIPAEMFEFTQEDAELFDQKIEGESVGYFKDTWLRFRRSRASVIAACIILIITLMAIFAPMLSPYTFRERHLQFKNLPARIPLLEQVGIADGSMVIEIRKSQLTLYEGAVKRIIKEYTDGSGAGETEMVRVKIDQYALAGAKEHYFWFGTDILGRSLFVRLWRGVRISLVIGLLSALINAAIGITYGAVSGYYGGKADMIMQRIIEIMTGIPLMNIAMLLVMAIGAGVWTFVLVLVLMGWCGMSKMIRAQFYRYKNFEYVLASKTMGAKDKRLIFRHILPNAFGPTITQMTFAIPSAIFTESMLAYLGLGIQAPEPSLGGLMSNGQAFLTSYPHLMFYPALVVSLLMLAFNIFGNGLRDAFDPRLREGN